jgi:hypothetical protein
MSGELAGIGKPHYDNIAKFLEEHNNLVKCNSSVISKIWLETIYNRLEPSDSFKSIGSWFNM